MLSGPLVDEAVWWGHGRQTELQRVQNGHPAPVWRYVQQWSQGASSWRDDWYLQHRADTELINTSIIIIWTSMRSGIYRYIYKPSLRWIANKNRNEFIIVNTTSTELASPIIECVELQVKFLHWMYKLLTCEKKKWQFYSLTKDINRFYTHSNIFTFIARNDKYTFRIL